MNFKSEETRQKVLDAQKRGKETRIKNLEKRLASLEEEYYKHPVLCKECDSILKYKKRHNKFCSQNCSATYNNKLRNKTRKETNCLFCGKVLERHNYKYCSLQCQHDLSIQNKCILIEDNCLVSKSSLRSYLMRKYDSKCQKCGWGIPNPVSKTVCLDLHHKDGDASNNVLDNVEILCPNCHSLTNTYKNVDSNRKSSRIYR
jgi:hypothetical protein